MTEPIEIRKILITFDLKILKSQRCFRPRRSVELDRAKDSIESNCPSGSKTSRIFLQNFIVKNFDGVRYTLRYTKFDVILSHSREAH